MNDCETIRMFEYDILDKHHQNFAFYQYSEDMVIPYLLQIYGDTERYRDDLIRKGHDETNLSFQLHNMLHGIGHCVRWILNNKNPKFTDTTGNSYLQLHEMAADFLNWGTGYHMIAQEFVTWSRKIKTVLLDEKKKTITFLNPQGYDYAKIYDKQILYAERMQNQYLSYPHDQMESEYREWINDIDFENPPIANHINWQRARNSKSYPLLYSKMQEIIFPELPESTDFLGYNLAELRQFYALVFLNFHFIRWVEAVLDSKAGEENLSFGSNPLYLNQMQFERLISNITGLPMEVAKSIISDLTFNHFNFHTSVTIQPFILSSTGTYYILPNLFSQLDPSRMILGALNKGSKKKRYDDLVNVIEKDHLNSIHQIVSKIIGCICHREKVIKLNGKKIHPDLILIDTSGKSLLVADYKHFIGPITASEVDYKMDELRKGIQQVENYIGTIANLSEITGTNIEGFSIGGAIITHKPLPVPIPNNATIPIIDLESFTEIVNLVFRQRQSATELLKIINAKNKEEPKNTFTTFESEITVEQWTIKRSQYKITQRI